MKSVQPITLGCSKNRVDTEHILSSLEGHYEIVPEGEERDFVDYLLVNTCGFIGDAKEESIQTILECVRMKQEGKAGAVYVFGCLSQRYSSEMPELMGLCDRILTIKNGAVTGEFLARDTYQQDELLKAMMVG